MCDSMTCSAIVLRNSQESASSCWHSVRGTQPEEKTCTIQDWAFTGMSGSAALAHLKVCGTELAGAKDGGRSTLEPLEHLAVEHKGFSMLGFNVSREIAGVGKPLATKHTVMIISVLDHFRKELPICVDSSRTELLRQVRISSGEALHNFGGASQVLGHSGAVY